MKKYSYAKSNDSVQQISPTSVGFGSKTISGGKGFKIGGIGDIEGNKYFFIRPAIDKNGVEYGTNTKIALQELVNYMRNNNTEDLYYSVKCNVMKVKVGLIQHIDIDNGLIFVDTKTFPTDLEIDGGDDTEGVNIEDYLTIVNHPEFGNIDVGFDSFAGGVESIAQDRQSFAFGRKNSVIGQYGVSFGRQNVAGYAAYAGGKGTIATGDYSHTEGNTTQALNTASHAEGGNTIAYGQYTHAEGYTTKATGSRSHAEGWDTQAIGDASHAEGKGSIAKGAISHAEGENTISEGYISHAEGENSIASGLASHAEGRNNVALNEAAHAEGENSIASGWVSHAEGSSKALGDFSHSEGNGNIAGGINAYSISPITAGNEDGNGCYYILRNEVINGIGNKVINGTEFQELYNELRNLFDTANNDGKKLHYSSINESKTSINYNIGEILNIENNFNEYENGAENDYAQIYIKVSNYKQAKYFSIVEYPNYGDTVYSGGKMSHAEGKNTKSIGYASHTEGEQTTASGYTSHAEGRNNIASNEAAHAEGENSIASGWVSHAEGASKALGDFSHSEGYGNTAKGSYSHSQNLSTTASGSMAHSEGWGSTAFGDVSHAEGKDTLAKGTISHAEGELSEANGYISHAEGYNTRANNMAAHSEGAGTIASGQYSHVQGKYNIEDIENKYAHIVGNGSDSKRSNAHTLDWNGNAWFAGDVKAGEISLSEINTKTGDLENLETNDKSSIVNAINEVRFEIDQNRSELSTSINTISDNIATITLTHNAETRCNTLTNLTIIATTPTDMSEIFMSSIKFTSGETATVLEYPEEIKMTGEDCIDGRFVPMTNKRYNIIFDFDGVYLIGVVGGVSI